MGGRELGWKKGGFFWEMMGNFKGMGCEFATKVLRWSLNC